MDYALLGNHKSGPHTHTLSPQGKGGHKPSGIAEAASANNRDLHCINHLGEENLQLWDEEDGFFYDALSLPDGGYSLMKVRSMVGLIALFAVETLEGEHIGFTGIHRIDWRHGVGHSGTFLGRTEMWNKGYGTDAVVTRTRYAFDTLGLRMLEAEVLVKNQASMRMVEKAGFAEVGRVPRRYWKHGRYRDVALFVAERDGWRPATGP